MNRILTFWIIAAISGFCVAEPVTKTRLAALHPRDGLVVTDVDMSGMLSTNDVCNIVTNEVADGWKITADNPDISLDGWYVELGYVMQMPAMIRHPRWYIKCDGWTHLKTNAFLEDATVLESEAERAIDSNKNGVFDEGEEIITFNVRAEKVSRNALGLATLKDIEGAVTVDKYDTNSVYFIDEEIPTMKLFTSYMRSPYWMNRMSAIEIGDKSQVLKTHYLQVDGNLAVNSPENIRFMSTLDRNSAYGEGKTLSLQDYLDAFNPVLVPDTIRMFQTNRSDYSVGNVTAHESLTVAKKDGGVAFKVTPDEANFMDVLKVKPTVGPLLYYPGQTNENGVVTNYYGYAETNANVKLKGNLNVTDSTAISSNLTVWGKLLLSSWENLRLAWKPYENDINDGKDCGYQQTLAEYVGNLVKPLVAATNEYAMGDEVIEVHTCTTNATSPLSRNGRIETVKDDVALLVTKNKATYVWDHDKVRTVLNNLTVGAWVSVSNAQLWVSSPGGIVGHQGKSENPRLDVKVIFDLSAWSYKVNLDVGTWNFVGMGDRVGVEGEWETIYSSVKPTERTETVIHTETYTWYDEYWDDELGEWVVDYDNPITETYEWYDEYTNNMIFEIEPYTCVEFHFKQVGPKAMKVDVQELYKTNPVR